RLLALPDVVKAQLENNELSAGHARAVLAVEGDEARVVFAREIATKRLPKSEAERLVKARRDAAPAARVGRDPHWPALAAELTRALGTRVRLLPRTNGGTIEIEFYSDAELDRLTTLLRGSQAGERAF